MNLYLTVIGIISTISCVLIIICINAKSPDPSSIPSQGSKSPLPSKGLNETQKSQILLIVCVIFFMSLLTTNVKTSKFSVMFNNLFNSFAQQSTIEKVTDLRQIFYGLKGNCQFKTKENKYPNLFDFLKDGQNDKKLLNKLYDKNFEQFKQQQIKSENKTIKSSSILQILVSNQQGLGVDMVLPMLGERICKSSSDYVPVIYLDLNKNIDSQQQLMRYLRMDSYQTLKQSICRLNGIQIDRQIKIAGNYRISLQRYSVISKQQLKDMNKNVYMIINNFEYLGQLLIFDNSKDIGDQYYNYKSEQSQNEQGEDKRYDSLINIGVRYELFIDKLINELINNCNINVILHTSRYQQVNKLYNRWKLINKQKQSLKINNQNNNQNNNQLIDNDNIKSNIVINQAKLINSIRNFPFNIKINQAINKIQFYSILKSTITHNHILKQHQSIVWKLFTQSFGQISPSNTIQPIQSQLNKHIHNHQQLTLNQLQTHFSHISSQINKINNKQTNKINNKLTNTNSKTNNNNKIKQYNDGKYQIAQFYGLQQTYEIIKNLSDLKSQQKGVHISTLKRKVSLQDIKKLEHYKIIYIKEGKVFISN